MMSTASRPPRYCWPIAQPGAFSPENRSAPSEKATSLASNASPLWHVTPSRILNSTVRPSTRLQLSARPGTKAPSFCESVRMSVSRTFFITREFTFEFSAIGSSRGELSVTATFRSGRSSARPTVALAIKAPATPSALKNRLFIRLFLPW